MMDKLKEYVINELNELLAPKPIGIAYKGVSDEDRAMFTAYRNVYKKIEELENGRGA